MNTTLDLELARRNLIEQQIRPWDIHDPQILDTLAAIPREAFVPAEQIDLAFMDIEIPLAQGQIMLSPKVDARLLQALDIQASDTVLEIGTGSGYLTACLATLGDEIHSVEYHSELLQQAERHLKQLNINNVTLWQGDASQGWYNGPQSYDAIIVTAALPTHNKTFEKQLNPGGRLITITGTAPVMTAHKTTRSIDGKTHAQQNLFELVIPPLIGCEPEKQFEF